MLSNMFVYNRGYISDYEMNRQYIFLILCKNTDHLCVIVCDIPELYGIFIVNINVNVPYHSFTDTNMQYYS